MSLLYYESSSLQTKPVYGIRNWGLYQYLVQYIRQSVL